MRIYLDAAAVIYAVEGIAPYAARVDARIGAPDVVQVVSDLTRLECRVQPIRDGNTKLLRAFDNYFTHVAGEIVLLSRDVVDRATIIRARYGFKTPDALHLAAAVISTCDIFLTNDRRLARFAELPIESLI